MSSYLNDKHKGKYLIFTFDGQYHESMEDQWGPFGHQVVAITVDSPVDTIFSLDQLFRLVYSLYFWLSYDPDNVVALVSRHGIKSPAAVIAAFFTMNKFINNPHEARRFVLQKREPEKDAEEISHMLY